MRCNQNSTQLYINVISYGRHQPALQNNADAGTSEKDEKEMKTESSTDTVNSGMDISTEEFITDASKEHVDKKPAEDVKTEPLEKNVTLSAVGENEKGKSYVAETSSEGDSSSELVIHGQERSRMVAPAYSTPNDTKKLPNSSAPTDLKQSLLSESGESTTVSSMFRNFSMRVDVNTLLVMNKGQLSGRLISVKCSDFHEAIFPQSRTADSSGNMADVSSNSGSASGTVNTKPLQYSATSTSSSSSLASSASTLARKLIEGKLGTQLKKDEQRLSVQRIEELKRKWANSNEIFILLDYLDRSVINADGTLSDDSFTKPKVSEEKEVEKVETVVKVEEQSTPVSGKTRAARAKRQSKVKFAASSTSTATAAATSASTSATDSDIEVPKKRCRRSDSVDYVGNMTINFSPGDSVFAKWGDRKFYAATLCELTSDGKWLVQFFDGDRKTLLEEFLIKAEEYTMIGHSVYASQGDDNFTPGIITGCESRFGTVHYVVARDKGDISVPPQFIYITESQARQIRGKTTAGGAGRGGSRAADALPTVTNKRSTRSKTRLLLADSPKPSSSGMQQIVQSDSDDDGNDAVNDANMEDVAGVEPESHGVYENGIKLKGKTVTGKMRFARTKANDKDANVLGPIPDKGSKYFKNVHALLTCTRPQPPKLPASDASKGSGSDTCTDSEGYKFTLVPFVKERLRLQLEAGGATVYNNFDDVPQKHWKNTYLISNRPNMSAKYIQCIAAGIKPVCHQWVIRCCIEKKRCPVQELPLGWSIESLKFMSWFNKKATVPLRKLNLLIVDTSDKNFYKFWSKVCKLGEATVTKLTRDSNLEQVYGVICEPGYRDEHVERVVSHSVPLLTTTWLVQSLLHGEVRPFYAHPSYRADYTDSD